MEDMKAIMNDVIDGKLIDRLKGVNIRSDEETSQDIVNILLAVHEIMGTKDVLESAILQLLSGPNEDIYLGIVVLYTQIYLEEWEMVSFFADRERLAEAARTAVKRQNDIKDGLWPKINMYRCLMNRKFGLVI